MMLASFLAADLATSVRCYDRAVSLFEGLGDHYGLVSSLVMTMTTRAGTSFFDSVVEDVGAFPCARADGERALELARRLEWRAGESFTLWTLGTLLAHYGVFGRALEVTQLGCTIAEEMGHTQWQASSQWTLVMIYLDLLVPRRAGRSGAGPGARQSDGVRRLDSPRPGRPRRSLPPRPRPCPGRGVTRLRRRRRPSRLPGAGG